MCPPCAPADLQGEEVSTAGEQTTAGGRFPVKPPAGRVLLRATDPRVALRRSARATSRPPGGTRSQNGAAVGVDLRGAESARGCVPLCGDSLESVGRKGEVWSLTVDKSKLSDC